MQQFRHPTTEGPHLPIRPRSAQAQVRAAARALTAGRCKLSTGLLVAVVLGPGLFGIASASGGLRPSSSGAAHGSLATAAAGSGSATATTAALTLYKPIVGMAAGPNGGGYWLVASDGGIFSFGDAAFHGSLGAMTLNKPIVGMAAGPNGGGYWLVASDGGIFAFGDAQFHGSLGAMTLNKPIVGMAATPDGGGYWLVASDGGIFAFGDAQFHGSLGSQVPSAPIIDMSATAKGSGYTLAGSDGAAYGFPTTTSAGPAAGGTAFGLSVPALQGDSATQQSAAYANMSSIGLRWVRIDANWSVVQAGGPLSYDWTALDQSVSAIRAAGMNVDMTIDYAPAWARAADATGKAYGQPASAAAFATFAGQVAAHYGPDGVSTYEIWNEPNLQEYFEPAPDPSFYTTMLRDSYAAIKSVQPASTVLSGGLAPAASDGVNINAVDFLTSMYADGAAGSFDDLGYHAYSYPALPDTYETWSGWSQMDQTSPSLRGVMTANGDSGKQIWITEAGAPSAGPSGVGTAAQAEAATEAIQGARNASWIGALFFYTYQDSATDPDYFGLIDGSGVPKQAWTAVAAALG